MTWEDNLKIAGQQQIQLNEDFAQKHKNIVRIFKNMCTIIEEYNRKFENMGIYVSGDGSSNLDNALSYSALYRAPKIDGGISIRICIDKWDSYIRLESRGHSRKIINLIRDDISRDEISNMLKHATEVPIIVDRIKKILGVYHGNTD